jgi:hypothetical protein
MIAERNGRSQALARVLARHTLAPQLCCSQPRMGFSGTHSRTAPAQPAGLTVLCGERDALCHGKGLIADEPSH